MSIIPAWRKYWDCGIGHAPDSPDTFPELRAKFRVRRAEERGFALALFAFRGEMDSMTRLLPRRVSGLRRDSAIIKTVFKSVVATGGKERSN